MKSFIIIILFIVFYLDANCQIISDYGIKLGIGLSNQSWDYQGDVLQFDFDSKLGISPRLFADFLNISFFQIEGEIGYLRKGYEEKIPITTMAQPDGTGDFITTNIALDYLSVSALVKLKYELEIISPFIILGPQLNFLLNKNIEKGWEVIFDRFRNANVDLSIGVGTELKNILAIPIIFEYRFERDFIDNYDLPDINIKNYSHVILLGIKI